jgi:signal peptidase I
VTETLPAHEPLAPPPAPANDDRESLRAQLARFRKNPIVDLLLTLAVALGIAYAVQAAVVKPYKIPSGSMERTFHLGDRVLAARFLYRFEDPHRGDILIFHPNGVGDEALPGDHVASATFTKRLIGLPGEWISASHGHVQVCTSGPAQGCKTLQEPYVSSTQQDFGPIHVPAGHYFMMGDNRDDSDDSRDWGPIAKKQIIGRAFMTYWPPDRISFY